MPSEPEARQNFFAAETSRMGAERTDREGFDSTPGRPFCLEAPMRRGKRFEGLAHAAALVLGVTSCQPPAPVPAPQGSGVAAVTAHPPGHYSAATMKPRTLGPPGLTMTLSEGHPRPSMPYSPPKAQAASLPAQATEALLERVAPLHAAEGERKSFALPPAPLPPPRAGKTIHELFPPPGAQVAPPGKETHAARTALHVLRFEPTGEVPIAPRLTITFDQPMVPISSFGALAKGKVPAQLVPTPPGHWEWLGTRTLQFVPRQRFPMATRYRVVVPAGTRSANGDRLGEEVRFSFSTPPPKLVSEWPEEGPQRLDVPIFLAFDQAIDPAAVAALVEVRNGSSQPVAVKLLSEAEAKKDERLAPLIASAQPKRWLALEPKSKLKPGTTYSVVVPAGTPSAEGPRKTAAEQSFSFRTFDPLVLTDHRCGWWNGVCRPGVEWTVTFNNPLDEKAFDASWIGITPALPDQLVSVQGDGLVIQGRSRARTTYKVRVSEKLRDTFGQTLGQAATVEFAVGRPEPLLSVPGNVLVVLDPASHGQLTVSSRDIEHFRFRAWKVQTKNWTRGLKWISNAYYSNPPPPPGTLVIDRTVHVAPPRGDLDALANTAIDLAPALSGGHGHVLVEVTPPESLWKRVFGSRPEHLRRWVEVTDLGVDAFVDATSVIAWVSRLSDGKAVAGAQVVIEPDGKPSETGPDGLARLQLPSSSGKAMQPFLLARTQSGSGVDEAILPANLWGWSNSDAFHQSFRPDTLLWYVIDDRGLYKPGETARFKGFVRTSGGGPQGDVKLPPAGLDKVTYVVHDARYHEIARGEARVDPLGGFDFAVKLPPDADLGTANVVIETNVAPSGFQISPAYHSFLIEAYRRPEYEVTAKASDGPYVLDSTATVTVSARYYAGGPLGGAPVGWTASAQPGHFTPPGQSDYVFGVWSPWWEPDGDDQSSKVQAFSGKTDGAGEHTLAIRFDSANPPRPFVVDAEATVHDVNQQAWTAKSELLVHPSSLYVGIKTPKWLVREGHRIHVDALVVGIDGKPVPGNVVTIEAARREWTYENGKWQEKSRDQTACETRPGEKATSCDFTATAGGTWRIRATVVDDRGRPNESELTVWVPGGAYPKQRRLGQEKVRLIPDQQHYEPGEVAHLLVESPFAPAEGLLTLRRSGLLDSRRFHLSTSSTTLDVPITAGEIPNVWAQVDVVGSAPVTDATGRPVSPPAQRPAFASGEIDLSIPPKGRTLTVTPHPVRTPLEPGAKTSIDVDVHDASGNPVAGAEVALIVVDDAVLALTNYKLTDPLALFYRNRSPDVTDYHNRSWVELALQPPRAQAEGGGGFGQGALGGLGTRRGAQMMFEERGRATMMDLATAAPAAAPRMMEKKSLAHFGGPAAPTTPIAVRTNFNALALFSPHVTTDARGHASVPVSLPDSLTRYRVMAVAVAGQNRFGSGESALVARLPLMVRPSPPRFLRFGDVFDLPIVVQNQTGQPMHVELAARVTNLKLTEGAGRQLDVPANDRVEVLLPAEAEDAGTARIQVAVASGKYSDAADEKLPVWTPATTEAFATYGEVDAKGGSAAVIRQPIRVPPDAIPSFGQLEVTTSSTQLQALTDAFLYLQHYPFECSEQVSSRVLSVAALRDVLQAFKARGMPSQAAIAQSMKTDIEHLAKLQNYDGGFGFWRQGDSSWPFLTVHVMHALIVAKAKGYDVPTDTVARGLEYLRHIDQHFPSWYPEEIRRAITAYALAVRTRAGDRDDAWAERLVEEAGGLSHLSLEAVGWLYQVVAGTESPLAPRIRRDLNNRVTETAGEAHFVTHYSDGEYLLLHSSRRADGAILDALITDQPSNDLIPKIVRGLLAHRQAGRWSNTEDNVFVLLALDHYFHAFESVTPDFVVKMWLGSAWAGQQSFRGRSTDFDQLEVPMPYLASHGQRQDLVLAKSGAGRLYYRVGMSYAPKSLFLAPADHGFVVQRKYEAVDHPKDVTRDEHGVWHIKDGARVRVRLTMVVPTRRYHVALVDPLPAGLEPLNPVLATTGTLPADPKDESGRRPSWWWWYEPWYEHDALKDEEAEAFSSLVWAGVYNYSYVARATTPGTFVVPPPTAEEMYMPETFGRGASCRVVVER